MKAIHLTIAIIICSVTGRAWALSYPQQEGEQLEFATQLLGQSQYESAASTYEDFIRQFPHSPLLSKAYVGAGDSLFFLKEPDKAMEYYRQYESQFPRGAEKSIVSLREAQCLYLDGKLDQVLAKLHAIDPKDLKTPFDLTYYFYMGKALMDKGRLKEAAKNFETILQKSSKGQYTTLAYLNLSIILKRAGNDKLAEELYNSAVESGDSLEAQAQIELIKATAYLKAQQYELAAMSFEDIVDHYPNTQAARDAAINWFITLLKNNQADEVIAQYNQRFSNEFDDPLTGRIHLLAVDALLSEKKYDDALDILNTLIATPGVNAKIKSAALFKKAHLMADTDHFSDSLNTINNHSSLNPESKVSVQLLKAQSYLGLGQYDKAEAIYDAALKADPDQATSYCGKAHILHARQEDASAADWFMQCFHKAKDEAYGENALYSAFMMYKATNNMDQALKTSALYQKTFPQGVHINDVALNVAELYAHNKQYDKANDLLKALAANTSSYQYQREALFQVAYNLQLEGKNDESLKLYDLIVAQNTDPQLTLMALKNSLMIYSQANNQDKVAQTMGRIVLNFPSNNFDPQDYQWLLNYWQLKGFPASSQDVVNAVKKHLKEKDTP